ncbi:MAG: HlyD family type I secretion periplasmic adaptor subunit [Leptothrix sp. (in: b-proteobacteria)]
MSSLANKNSLPLVSVVPEDPGLLPVMSRVARFGWAALMITVLALVSFMSVASLEGAVVASGAVKVDLNRKVVQHQEGGIVHAVYVRDGQQVVAGQVLLELSDVAVNASVGLLRNQRDAELTRTARLEAEKTYARHINFPTELTNRRTEPEVDELVARERALFAARRSTLESQQEVLRRQIDEVQAEIRALDQQLVSERKAGILQQEELRLNERLAEQHYIDRPKLIALERALAEYVTRIGSHEADLARARQKINDLKLKMLSLRNDYSESATRDQRESSSRLLEVEQRLQPTQDAANRQRIVAPVGGEVVGLKVFSAGAVIGPRDVLMEIMPVGAKLVIEARVRPEDIVRIKPGAAVDVRLTAFSHRDTPVVVGQVDYISADAFTDQTSGARYYTIMVQVSQEALNQAGNLYLQAGMPAEVYVKTKRRTIAAYLFEPVSGFLSHSMREN